jgi:uncharacterized protein YkwD
MNIVNRAFKAVSILASVLVVGLSPQTHAAKVRAQDDGGAPLNYEAVAGRFQAYRGREVLVEGRLTSIRKSGNSVMLVVTGRRTAFVRCMAAPASFAVGQPVALLARVPHDPMLNYVEFVEIYGDEDAAEIETDPELSRVKFDERAEEALFALVNQEREQAGLRPYRWNEKLRTASRRHCGDMILKNYVSHNSDDGDTVAKRVAAAGISYAGVGENLASAPTVKQAHKGLMDSPGHRSNIMSKDFTEIGIGIAKTAEGSLIVVQNFIYRH